MKKFYLIHGFGSLPNGGWAPWLGRELYKSKIFLFALALPNPKAPKKDEWLNKIKEEIVIPSEDTYLIGHSLGASAMLQYLETLQIGTRIGGAFLVAGVFGKINSEDPGAPIRPIDNFFDKPFDFEHIKKVCNKFYVIQGEDDPNVPFFHAESFSRELGVPITKVNGKGHYSYLDTFEFPELLELILKEIN